MNIYAPNKDACSRKFFENLQRVLSEFGITNEDNVIIGGDFNCPLNPLLDKKGGILIPRANEIRAIETLKEKFSLQDIWRVKNPDLKSFTWSQKSPFVFCRLDYWITSFHLFDNVKNVDIVPAIKTDHSAITIEFQSIDQQLKGPGSWKLNVSLLLKKDYIEEMEFNKPIWRNESISFFQDQQMSWEWIKYRRREFSINFSKRIARESQKEELELREKIDELKTLHDANPSNETLNNLGPVPERRNNSIPGINVPYFRDNFIPGLNFVPERRNNAIKGINLG